MTLHLTGIVLVLAAVGVESFAQLFLKLGAANDHRGWVALGVAAYAVEIALYTAALHCLDVSVAFPLGSLCFVGVALLSRWFLGETIGRLRWLGIACILVGTFVVAA